MRSSRPLLFVLTVALIVASPALAHQQSPVAETDQEEATFLLGPSDVIRAWVWNEPELTSVVTVRPDGKVSLPLAGEVHVAGLTPSEVEEEIRGKLAGFFEATVPPVVVVIVEQINSPQFSVLGEVRNPNRFLMRQRLTVVEGIAMAGGFTEFADMGDVIVMRRDGTRVRIDLKRLLEDGQGSPVFLQSGDTVYVK